MALTDAAQNDPNLFGDPPAAATPQGLADRGALALIAVERTRMPMVVSDPRQPDNPIVLANKAFLELTGYSPEEIMGRNCRVLQGPETSRDAVARIRAAVQEERHIELELLNYRKDGSTFWNLLGLSPIHDCAGRLVYFFGSQIDITRQRRAEELEAAQHALLMEVDHRANNVLALVEGIVRLSRSDSAHQYAASVQGRVQALARAHSLLADEQWKAAPLGRLLCDQIEPYGMGRVAMIGAPLVIEPQFAQPLSMIIHELASNAAIHGSLSNAVGQLAVRWRNDDDRDLRLTWEETGGPIPSESRRVGTGTAILRGVLEGQLGGDIHEEWRNEGLKLQIRVPNVVGVSQP